MEKFKHIKRNNMSEEEGVINVVPEPITIIKEVRGKSLKKESKVNRAIGGLTRAKLGKRNRTVVTKLDLEKKPYKTYQYAPVRKRDKLLVAKGLGRDELAYIGSQYIEDRLTRSKDASDRYQAAVKKKGTFAYTVAEFARDNPNVKRSEIFREVKRRNGTNPWVKV